MSPDFNRNQNSGDRDQGKPVRDAFLRELFEKTQPDLEAKASESMPRDLDALFEKRRSASHQDNTIKDDGAPDGHMASLLEELFSHDLQHDSQMGSPARLDAATASELDRRVAEGIREDRPQPIPLGRMRAPQWSGLAAAGLIGMLYLWGQGYLSGDADGGRPLFVLMDVDQPLNTSMDPGAISLAAAGAIDFVEGKTPGRASPTQTSPTRAQPKKGGEE